MTIYELILAKVLGFELKIMQIFTWIQGEITAVTEKSDLEKLLRLILDRTVEAFKNLTGILTIKGGMLTLISK